LTGSLGSDAILGVRGSYLSTMVRRGIVFGSYTR